MSTEIINNTLSMSQLIDGISEGLCVCNTIEEYPYIRFTVWNKKMIDITGYTIDEINEKGFMQVLYEVTESGEIDFSLIDKISRNQLVNEEELNIRRKDGSRKHIAINTSIVKNENDVEHVLTLVRDITKQKHMERELKEINESFNILFEVSPDAVFIHDGKSIMNANAAAVKLLGAKELDELLGYSMFNFVHPDYHKIVEERMAQTRKTGEMLATIEEKFIKLNGGIIDVEVSGAPFFYKGNSYNLVIVRDITERVKTETELRKSRKKFRDLFNNINDSIFIYRFNEPKKNDFFIEANNAACKRLGYSREELYKLTPFDIDPTLDINTAESLTNDIFEKVSTLYNTKHITRSGEAIPVEISTMFFDLDGERVLMSIARDTTERIKQEQSLKESEERYRSLIEMLPYAVFIRNKEKILFANKKGLELLDVDSEEEILNRNFKEILIPHSDYIMKRNENEEFLLKNGYLPLSEEKFILLKNNKTINFESVIQKYSYQGKKAILIVAKDISKQKENEQLQKKMEEKIKLLNEAKEYEKLRTEFFANISHELRTPINVILSTLQLCGMKMDLIENNEEIDKLKRHTVIMKQNCYRLIRLINNLIDVTKIDSGYIHINLNNYNIVSIVEEITLSIAEYIENKGISLIFDTDVEEKITACDPDIIERIMLNLISNAVKFTEPGGEILVTMTDKEKSIGISVKDTDIGIPREKQKHIFERFVQVDKSLTRTREGSGIGLSLVKSLVEMHKGTISVSSKYGKGSEFIVDIPVTILESSKASSGKKRRNLQGNIEKINVEFSDIYF